MQKARILVIDDEESLLRILTKYLEKKGYQVFGFTSAKEALEEVPRIKPDLVITDILMPEMNGVEFIDEFHKIQPDTEVICLSAHATPATLENLKQKNVFEFIPKPFNFKQIEEIIPKAIKSSRSKRLKSAKEESHPSRGNILVADDFDVFRKLVKDLLTREGYYVDTAADGEEALEKIYMNNYDIVILDINMPRLNGLETLKKIKEYDKNLMVVMITGEAETEVIKKCEEITGYICLRKPMDNRKFVKIIKQFDCEAIRKRRQQEIKRKLQEQLANRTLSQKIKDYIDNIKAQLGIKGIVLIILVIIMGAIIINLFIIYTEREATRRKKKKTENIIDLIEKGLEYLRRDELRELRSGR